jgi:hypothetical protein
MKRRDSRVPLGVVPATWPRRIEAPPKWSLGKDYVMGDKSPKNKDKKQKTAKKVKAASAPPPQK